MTAIDFAILAIIGLSALMSMLRGFVSEVMSLIVWILALWCSAMLSGQFAAQFLQGITVDSLRLGCAYILVFLLVLLTGGAVTWLIRKLIIKTGLSSTDRLLGSIFGLARGLLIVFSAILFAGFTELPSQPFWRESALIPGLSAAASELAKHLPAGVSKYLNFSAQPPAPSAKPAEQLPAPVTRS
jgi:membrane protein required for colicin V production